jgi:hypothetical protein
LPALSALSALPALIVLTALSSTVHRPWSERSCSEPAVTFARLAVLCQGFELKRPG